MPVMLILLALQFVRGSTPGPDALFALPQSVDAGDGAAAIEQVLLR